MRKSVPFLALGLVALALLVGLAAGPSRAADHLDAPGLTPPGGDTRLDINDVYAFQSPANSANSVLIMTLSPAAGVIGALDFHAGAQYDLKVNNQGSPKEEITFRLHFSPPGDDGRQAVTLRRLPAGKGGAVLARGMTGEAIAVRGGGTLQAGLFDDPFFFDLNAFLGTNGRTFCDGMQNNFFLGLNTLAIVLELPSSQLGGNIGVWARTELNGAQIDRMGRPAINTVFIPNNPFEPVGTEPSQKNAFNAGMPRHDQRDFRGEVVDTLELFYGAGNPTAQALADILLPDILTFDTANPGGFLNGRQLADDVIDIELGIVTNGIVTSDCVGSDSAFSGSFPYLAAAN
ncbi:MAG: DUF4331 family protein [Candidatus Promineifilaceae bacterium]